MQDAMTIWDSICHSQWFKQTSIVRFFPLRSPLLLDSVDCRFCSWTRTTSSSGKYRLQTSRRFSLWAEYYHVTRILFLITRIRISKENLGMYVQAVIISSGGLRNWPRRLVGQKKEKFIFSMTFRLSSSWHDWFPMMKHHYGHRYSYVKSGHGCSRRCVDLVVLATISIRLTCFYRVSTFFHDFTPHRSTCVLHFFAFAPIIFSHKLSCTLIFAHASIVLRTNLEEAALIWPSLYSHCSFLRRYTPLFGLLSSLDTCIIIYCYSSCILLGYCFSSFCFAL